MLARRVSFFGLRVVGFGFLGAGLFTPGILLGVVSRPHFQRDPVPCPGLNPGPRRDEECRVAGRRPAPSEDLGS